MIRRLLARLFAKPRMSDEVLDAMHQYGPGALRRIANLKVKDCKVDTRTLAPAVDWSKSNADIASDNLASVQKHRDEMTRRRLEAAGEREVIWSPGTGEAVTRAEADRLVPRYPVGPDDEDVARRHAIYTHGNKRNFPPESPGSIKHFTEGCATITRHFDLEGRCTYDSRGDQYR